MPDKQFSTNLLATVYRNCYDHLSHRNDLTWTSIIKVSRCLQHLFPERFRELLIRVHFQC